MPDNQSAVPVSRVREIVRSCNYNPHPGATFNGGEDGAVRACEIYSAECTAEVDALRAENARLREAVNAALNWIDNDDCSQMGPAEDAAHTRLIRKLEAALTDATNRGEE